MKIEEFKKLYDDEKNNLLRYPTNKDIETLCMEDKYVLRFLIEEYFSVRDDEEYIKDVEKLFKKKFKLKGKGTKEDPITINANFGSGSFMHFSEFFNKEVPQFFKKNYCYQNAYEFAKQSKEKCKILSGIAFRDYPFLHSVILVNGYILDFNYNLAMSKNLYLNLFNFETLNQINGEDVKSNKALFNKNNKFLKENKIGYGEVVFCFDELVEILKQEKTCEANV